MILWIVWVLFGLTALLAALRFFKKKDPFGGLDASEKESLLEKARRTRDNADPEGAFRNRNGSQQ